MPIAVNRQAVREYTLKGDESGTVFYLRVLDRPLRNWLFKRVAITKDAESVLAVFEDIVRYGIQGWTQFFTSEGKPVEIETTDYTTPVGKRTGLKEAALDYFTKEGIAELTAAILDENVLKESDAKNSVSLSA